MKKTYIIPEVLFVDLINEGIMHSATEPNVGDWVGGKESSEFEDEPAASSDLQYNGPKNNLWDDEDE